MSYYKLLGVKSSADDEEIRAAYKKKALVAHPDKGGTPQLFKVLQEAYDTLHNGGSRRIYDAQLNNIVKTKKKTRAARAAPKPAPLTEVRHPVMYPLADGTQYVFETAPDRLRCRWRYGDIVGNQNGESGTVVGMTTNGLYWKRDDDSFASLLCVPGGIGGDGGVTLTMRPPSTPMPFFNAPIRPQQQQSQQQPTYTPTSRASGSNSVRSGPTSGGDSAAAAADKPSSQSARGASCSAPSTPSKTKGTTRGSAPTSAKTKKQNNSDTNPLPFDVETPPSSGASDASGGGHHSSTSKPSSATPAADQSKRTAAASSSSSSSSTFTAATPKPAAGASTDNIAAPPSQAPPTSSDGDFSRGRSGPDSHLMKKSAQAAADSVPAKKSSPDLPNNSSNDAYATTTDEMDVESAPQKAKPASTTFQSRAPKSSSEVQASEGGEDDLSYYDKENLAGSKSAQTSPLRSTAPRGPSKLGGKTEVGDGVSTKKTAGSGEAPSLRAVGGQTSSFKADSDTKSSSFDTTGGSPASARPRVDPAPVFSFRRR